MASLALNEILIRMEIVKNSRIEPLSSFNGFDANLMFCGIWQGLFQTFPTSNNNYNYIGNCKYEFATTNCSTFKLPSHLAPFNVRVKFASFGVPSIVYTELNYMGTQYRIYKATNDFTVDGVKKAIPYENQIDGLVVNRHENGILLTMLSGARVFSRQNAETSIQPSTTYDNFLCGLCATGVPYNKADRNGLDLYEVDRDGKPVTGQGPDRFIRWTNSWQVPDDSPDVNTAQCIVDKNVKTNPTPNCVDSSKYADNNWCGRLRELKLPWSDCLAMIDKVSVKALYDQCIIDICALEGRRAKQSDSYCVMFEQIIDACYEISKSINANWTLNWRDTAKCSIFCSNEKEYQIREDCPKTCKNPDGKYECSDIKRIDGCFCKNGLLENTDGECVETGKCPKE